MPERAKADGAVLIVLSKRFWNVPAAAKLDMTMGDDGGLPDGGLAILTNLIVHQDRITWTAFSILSGFQFAIFAVVLQGQALGPLSAFVVVPGLFLTLLSFLVTVRSYAYLDEYLRLARERASSHDREIFDVKITETWFRLIPAREALGIVHFGFVVAWVVFLFTG